jgi:hypothetical protein
MRRAAGCEGRRKVRTIAPGEAAEALVLRADRWSTNMSQIRLTHNAVATFHRRLRPADSMSGAYRALRHACEAARYTEDAPSWLGRTRADNDGYLLLDGETAALPLRHGRAVACLVNPNLVEREPAHTL